MTLGSPRDSIDLVEVRSEKGYGVDSGRDIEAFRQAAPEHDPSALPIGSPEGEIPGSRRRANAGHWIEPGGIRLDAHEEDGLTVLVTRVHHGLTMHERAHRRHRRLHSPHPIELLRPAGHLHVL